MEAQPIRPGSQVAKAMVCKTIIRGCNSHPGLPGVSHLSNKSPGGGIGIHERLKISCSQGLVGSSPTSGTNVRNKKPPYAFLSPGGFLLDNLFLYF